MKLPEFLSGPISTELKVGDTAYVHDWSYSTQVTSTRVSKFYPCDRNTRVTILATGCVLPAEGYLVDAPNDTIVSLESGEIVFTKLRYLLATEPK
jgi:hypothetical protein